MEFKLKRTDGTVIDSRFEAHTGATWSEITIASSGGGPDDVINSEYTEGLEEILRRLAFSNATLIAVILNSSPQTQRPISERIVDLDNFRYPVQLNYVQDLVALRAAITRHASRTLSSSQSGGNPRRRISLLIVAGARGVGIPEEDLVSLLQAGLHD